MKNWCKIIPLENHDVLVERLSNDEDGEHLSVKMNIDNVIASYTMSFGDDEQKADSAFDSLKSDQVQQIVDDAISMLKG